MTDKYAHFHLKNMHIYLGKETKKKKYWGGIKWTQKMSNYSKRMKKKLMIKSKHLCLRMYRCRIKVYLTWPRVKYECNPCRWLMGHCRTIPDLSSSSLKIGNQLSAFMFSVSSTVFERLQELNTFPDIQSRAGRVKTHSQWQEHLRNTDLQLMIVLSLCGE